MSVTTARDKFFYTRTLCCLLKALEGVETEIELRNDSSVKGTIEFVSAAMSVTMRDCVLVVNNRPKRLQRMAIQGRKIRMVLVPDDINMLDAMQGVIDMYNVPMGGRMEYQRQDKRRGRGRSRGRGGVGEGRGRGRGQTQREQNLHGDRRGEGAAGREASATGQAFGRGRGRDTVVTSHEGEHSSSFIASSSSTRVQTDVHDQRSISHRLLAVAMSSETQYSGADSSEEKKDWKGRIGKSDLEPHSHRTVGDRESGARVKPRAGNDSEPRQGQHKSAKVRDREGPRVSRESSTERYSDHSDTSDSGRSHSRQKQDRYHSHASGSGHHRGEGDYKSRSSHKPSVAVGQDDLRKKLLQKKKQEHGSSHRIERHHRHREHGSDHETSGDNQTGRGAYSGRKSQPSASTERPHRRKHHSRSPDTDSVQTQSQNSRHRPSSHRGHNSSRSVEAGSEDSGRHSWCDKLGDSQSQCQSEPEPSHSDRQSSDTDRRRSFSRQQRYTEDSGRSGSGRPRVLSDSTSKDRHRLAAGSQSGDSGRRHSPGISPRSASGESRHSSDRKKPS